MLEKNFKYKLVKRLNRLPLSDFEVSYPGSLTGKCDVTGCLNSRYVAIETKRPKKKPTPIQYAKHRSLLGAGALVYVATNWEEWYPLEKHMLAKCGVEIPENYFKFSVTPGASLRPLSP